MISETDTPEASALMDKAPRVECPLKISVSMLVISKICFSHLETSEEGIVLWVFTKLTRTCGSFTPYNFLLNE